MIDAHFKKTMNKGLICKAHTQTPTFYKNAMMTNKSTSILSLGWPDFPMQKARSHLEVCCRNTATRSHHALVNSMLGSRRKAPLSWEPCLTKLNSASLNWQKRLLWPALQLCVSFTGFWCLRDHNQARKKLSSQTPPEFTGCLINMHQWTWTQSIYPRCMPKQAPPEVPPESHSHF